MARDAHQRLFTKSSNLETRHLIRLIQVTDDKIDINDPVWGKKTLTKGRIYLTYKALAEKIVSLNWGKIVDDSNRLCSLPREALKPNKKPIKVLVLFAGGLGDAISAAILFSLLEKEYNLRIDVSCPYETWNYVLAPMGFCGKLIYSPIELELINKYDYIQTDLTNLIVDQTRKWDRCIIEELAVAYKVDMTRFDGRYSIPNDIMCAMKLAETTKIRIGVTFESKGRIRSYPDELGVQLILGLIGLGFEVYRFGSRQSNSMKDLHSDGYHDYSGRTNIFELAALLKQMDIVIGMDSFPVHLSNILGVRTIALLSTTTPGIFRMHKNVVCIHSQIDCLPCGAVMDKCPKGHDECVAFYHPSLSPERIIAGIIHECTSLFKGRLNAA